MSSESIAASSFPSAVEELHSTFLVGAEECEAAAALAGTAIPRVLTVATTAGIPHLCLFERITVPPEMIKRSALTGCLEHFHALIPRSDLLAG
ncbi:hypothetical protein ABT187_47830 [Streptomyces sp. NPDC001817]|uniref:hypothetical protein n=1 Tax=Streptomyces sp. NPDC001817 TaxID=3154398 RepID=UPI00331BFB90